MCKPQQDGWLVWLRRIDGSVSFNRTWDEYVEGFGDPNGNYWLGLHYLSQLTSLPNAPEYKLRVEINSSAGAYEWAEYNQFTVGNSSTDHELSYGEFSKGHQWNLPKKTSGIRFSTIDMNKVNCAAEVGGGGGWWYHSCDSNTIIPTGVYGGNGNPPYITWKRSFGNAAIRSVIMKIKQK